MSRSPDKEKHVACTGASAVAMFGEVQTAYSPKSTVFVVFNLHCTLKSLSKIPMPTLFPGLVKPEFLRTELFWEGVVLGIEARTFTLSCTPRSFILTQGLSKSLNCSNGA